MPRKKTYITVTDQFCGAGGSSQGVRRLSKRVKGIEVILALNHWKLAIDTHNTNFPDTIHDCTDISACDPRRYPSTDILITSPECTNHSLAKGVKIAQKQMDLFNSGKIDAAAERSRATMWDVCRFAEYHNYNCIIVENVVDARKWVMFDSWIHAMRSLGYKHRCCYINSMHFHPTPQSRDRMYIVFWKAGNKQPDLEYKPLALCPKCNNNVHSVQTWKDKLKQYGKYRQQYVYCCPSCSSKVEPYYYAAFNCIDWSDKGTRIGDRAKPLSPNTIRRIEHGLEKYGNKAFQVINYSPGYTKSIFDETGTLTTNDHHALLQPPFIIDDKQYSGVSHRVRGINEPVNTILTEPRTKILLPFVVKGEHSHNLKNATPVNNTLQTHTTRQSMAIVTPPFTITARGQSKAHRITDAITTQSQMINHGIVTSESWNSFIASYYNGSHCTKRILEEIGTVNTKDRHQLITYQEPKIEDCYYRMFKPKEIKIAMAFDNDYTVLGSGKDQVKQLGNAVTPPVMEWLVEQCIKSLS